MDSSLFLASHAFGDYNPPLASTFFLPLTHFSPPPPFSLYFILGLQWLFGLPPPLTSTLSPASHKLSASHPSQTRLFFWPPPLLSSLCFILVLLSASTLFKTSHPFWRLLFSWPATSFQSPKIFWPLLYYQAPSPFWLITHFSLCFISRILSHFRLIYFWSPMTFQPPALFQSQAERGWEARNKVKAKRHGRPKVGGMPEIFKLSNISFKNQSIGTFLNTENHISGQHEPNNVTGAFLVAITAWNLSINTDLLIVCSRHKSAAWQQQELTSFYSTERPLSAPICIGHSLIFSSGNSKH